MAPGKRLLHSGGHDRDGEDPGNKSKRRQGDSVSTQIGATRFDDKIKGDNRLVEKIVVPWLRKVVGEEVTTVLGRILHPYPSGQRQRTLQLRFKESPGKTFTGVDVEAKSGASLEVALYHCDSAASSGVEDRIVTQGSLSCTKIELCVLQGSFGSDGREDWSSEEFSGSILNETREGGKLLTGNLSLRLANGVVTVNNLRVQDISIWARTGHFRLGARVAETTTGTENIREAITQPFKVMHSRGMGNGKRDTPSLDDEIWRLEGIGRDGKAHELLQSKGISTVAAFLLHLDTDGSDQLKRELRGVGVGEKTWTKLKRHATKARTNQDARQPPYLPVVPFESEPQGLPQNELVPAALQGLSVASTSTWHFVEAGHAGQVEGVSNAGVDTDLDEVLAWSSVMHFDEVLAGFSTTAPAHEGHGSYQSSSSNSGAYISRRGSGTAIWSQVLGAFKAIRTWLRLSRARRKGKLVPRNC